MLWAGPGLDTAEEQNPGLPQCHAYGGCGYKSGVGGSPGEMWTEADPTWKEKMGSQQQEAGSEGTAGEVQMWGIAARNAQRPEDPFHE